jgi:hypothetical protein
LSKVSCLFIAEVEKAEEAEAGKFKGVGKGEDEGEVIV